MRMANYETGANVILGGSIDPRIRAALEKYAQRKGMPVREYVNTHTGFMAALLALNNEVRGVVHRRSRQA